MNWNDFNFGFWHPFGTHGGEETANILNRKAREISDTGWTLWSFQHRTPATVREWFNLIEASKVGPIYTICSDSPGAKDGAGAVNHCTEYLLAHAKDWLPIPSTIQIPHPFNNTNTATAFVVKRLIHPAEELHNQPSFAVEWFSQGEWRNDKVPTRGEYLIRRGGQLPLRRVAAVLELQAPYVVSVRADML